MEDNMYNYITYNGLEKIVRIERTNDGKIRRIIETDNKIWEFYCYNRINFESTKIYLQPNKTTKFGL